MARCAITARCSAILGALLQKPLQDETVSRPPAGGAISAGLYSRTRSPMPWWTMRCGSPCRRCENLRAKGLVNAILRNFLRQPRGLAGRGRCASEEARYSHPQWWIDKLRRQYPRRVGRHCWKRGNQHPAHDAAGEPSPEYRPKPTWLSFPRPASRGVVLGQSAILLEQPVAVDKLPGFAAGAGIGAGCRGTVRRQPARRG